MCTGIRSGINLATVNNYKDNTVHIDKNPEVGPTQTIETIKEDLAGAVKTGKDVTVKFYNSKDDTEPQPITLTPANAKALLSRLESGIVHPNSFETASSIFLQDDQIQTTSSFVPFASQNQGINDQSPSDNIHSLNVLADVLDVVPKADGNGTRTIDLSSITMKGETFNLVDAGEAELGKMLEKYGEIVPKDDPNRTSKMDSFSKTLSYLKSMAKQQDLSPLENQTNRDISGHYQVSFPEEVGRSSTPTAIRVGAGNIPINQTVLQGNNNEVQNLNEKVDLSKALDSFKGLSLQAVGDPVVIENGDLVSATYNMLDTNSNQQVQVQVDYSKKATGEVEGWVVADVTLFRQKYESDGSVANETFDKVALGRPMSKIESDLKQAVLNGVEKAFPTSPNLVLSTNPKNFADTFRGIVSQLPKEGSASFSAIKFKDEGRASQDFVFSFPDARGAERATLRINRGSHDGETQNYMLLHDNRTGKDFKIDMKQLDGDIDAKAKLMSNVYKFLTVPTTLNPKVTTLPSKVSTDDLDKDFQNMVNNPRVKTNKGDMFVNPLNSWLFSTK